MQYQYKPSGVCSTSMTAEISDEGIIESLLVKDGCSGNSKGVSQLVIGRHMDEIIGLLEGITCGRKKTSCPDQIAKMLIGIRQARTELDP